MANDAYRSYLLRLWRVEDDGGHWRVRLEDIKTGEVQGFASLELLMVFFQNLESRSEPSDTEGGEANEGEGST